MKFLNKVFKKRNTAIDTEDPSFVPVNTFGRFDSKAHSPVLARCVNLYSGLLNMTPLEADKDNSVLRLINGKPCSFMSRYNFFQILAEHLLVWANFYCVVDYDKNYNLAELSPYLAPQAIRAYPRFGRGKRMDSSNEFVDPVELSRKGYFFQDYKSRTFNEEEIWHIKDLSFNSQNVLEGESRFKRVFYDSFATSSEIPKVLFSIASQDLKPPVLLSGLGGDDKNQATAKEMKEVKASIRKFFQRDNPESKRVLTLPPGYKIEKLSFDNASSMLQLVHTLASLDIARIMGVPSSLIYTSDVQTERDAKEARRFFISSSFASLCKVIEDSLSELTDYECEFKFNLDKLRILSADLREESAMIQAYQNIFSPKEIKEKVNLN